jgi:D-tyrosyl-tRNA(Tyr) deacylase
MRIVLQRVSQASVSINGAEVSRIGAGLLLLAGFAEQDTHADIDRLCEKIVKLRIFSDADGKMNLSVQDVGGDILAVSQFTLYASTRKGNRPSFIEAAPPAVSEPLYRYFVSRLEALLGKTVGTGVFGADMQVSLLNDGPVTLVMETGA